MARLISLRQIRNEKIDRSAQWVWDQIANGGFPRPIVRSSRNLWDEAAVDRWIVDYIAKAQVSQQPTARTVKATQARMNQKAGRNDAAVG